MTKVYKINGREIPQAGIWQDGDYFSENSTEYVLNLLLEALADKEETKDEINGKQGVLTDNFGKIFEPKQEEIIGGAGGDGYKDPLTGRGLPKQEEYDHYMGYIGKTPESKQSTSLKEEIVEMISEGKTSPDKILSLIQSHLVKEIEKNATIAGAWGIEVLEKKTLIKIINNI